MYVRQETVKRLPETQIDSHECHCPHGIIQRVSMSRAEELCRVDLIFQ
jgi:hypothetical protein